MADGRGVAGPTGLLSRDPCRQGTGSAGLPVPWIRSKSLRGHHQLRAGLISEQTKTHWPSEALLINSRRAISFSNQSRLVEVAPSDLIGRLALSLADWGKTLEAWHEASDPKYHLAEAQMLSS